MTYHEMIHIPDETLAVFEEFEQDYLADVFRIWDCYAQDWADPFVTLFRFESDDVLVWCDNGRLHYRIGPIDTNTTARQIPVSFDIENADTSCLAWVSDPGFSDYLGQQSNAQNLLQFMM